MEWQLQNTLQNTAKDIVPDKQETDLIGCMKDLMLGQSPDMTTMTDKPVPPPEVPTTKDEISEDDPMIPYSRMEEEARLQCEEEK